MFGVEHLASTAYRPQKNGQINWNNHTLASRLCDYDAKNQENRNKLVQLISYTYNTQMYKFTNFSHTSLVLSPRPLGPETGLQPVT